MSRTEAAQHTPGPWRVETRGGMDGREVRVGATFVVATVNTTSNEEGNRLANARLIAAAPRMYEFIRAFIDGRASLAEADEIRRQVEG
mgnify:CR=1 FL=1